MTSLPRLEDLPVADRGFDQDRVREAFDAYRRHALQLQAQLRVLQAAGGRARSEPTGHAVRMDALHLIRAAAEFADQLERDAQNASSTQIRRTEEEIRRKQREIQAQEADVERFRAESERQRAEMISTARAEAQELLTRANKEATRELQEAEARGARLLEQSRHQATELTNSARAEVEQTLEWARTQATAVMTRAQQGAEQLLSAAGLTPEDMEKVVSAIMAAATRGPGEPVPETPPQQPRLVPEPAAEDDGPAPGAQDEPPAPAGDDR
ncbi:MAG: hypothetical protein ABR521_02595 [Gaiellaceae bacterium]